MTLVFWFDVHSPWVYLAAHRIGDLARRHGLELSWRPLHLPRLLDQIGGVKPLEATPARVAWFRQDIQDWAEVQGLSLRIHPQYPLRNSRALRENYPAASSISSPWAMAPRRRPMTPPKPQPKWARP